jgi:hypothetical protein
MNTDGPVLTIHFVGGPWHGKWKTGTFPDARYIDMFLGQGLAIRDDGNVVHVYWVNQAAGLVFVAKYVTAAGGDAQEISELD